MFKKLKVAIQNQNIRFTENELVCHLLKSNEYAVVDKIMQTFWNNSISKVLHHIISS